MGALDKKEKQTTVWHVTPKDDLWQVKGAGNAKATKLFKTQKEAIDFANELSKKHEGSVLIHRTTGQVRASINNKSKK
ncbi:Uncharacterised protein [Mycoplasmopsis maculosa]|uniref:DUF2188 domain-containing protein n=1 Tax=Mycoplasmopsis maculosa TaxID=114885 RepID=A0A449B568_9BACT|nr:DUF2188 domain-containing protein [Mycoplasmopsis maculosa]VEU75751.1 Uncharacterised protein [Mycoplasmopsis maculosa]